MLQVDGFLILLAANCNSQVPARLYEYLRAQRPIYARTDAVGDTFASLRAAGVDSMTPLDKPVAIAQELVRLLELLHDGTAPIATKNSVCASSRPGRTSELANCLDCVKLN